jgi:tetratricopeptide (TPR) repeat protein
MDGASADFEHTLAHLVATDPAARGSYIRAAGEPGRVLRRFVEQAERLIIEDPAAALDAASVLVGVAGDLGDAGGESRARRVRAQALAYANRFDEALDELTRSANLAGAAGDTEAAARARLSMVHALARLGRLDEAVAAGEAALRGFHELGDALWAAKAEANLGGTRRMIGDAAAALAHFDRARPALAGEPTGLAQVDSNRAEALLELNRFAEAETAFRSALRCFEEAGAAQAAAIVEGNIADLMSRQGRLETALHYFERAALPATWPGSRRSRPRRSWGRASSNRPPMPIARRCPGSTGWASSWSRSAVGPAWRGS